MAAAPEPAAPPSVWLLAVVCVCCWLGEELAGAGGGLLAGLAAPASSRAANGWLSVAWLCDAAADSADDETVVEELGAILGTLGTVGHSGSDNNNDCLLATGRPGRLS